jgi:hypothetical protein
MAMAVAMLSQAQHALACYERLPVYTASYTPEIERRQKEEAARMGRSVASLRGRVAHWQAIVDADFNPRAK